MPLRVRIPSWVDDFSEVFCYLNGKNQEFERQGPYIEIDKVKKDESFLLNFHYWRKQKK